jgi:cell division protein FtsB
VTTLTQEVEQLEYEREQYQTKIQEIENESTELEA